MLTNMAWLKTYAFVASLFSVSYQTTASVTTTTHALYNCSETCLPPPVTSGSTDIETSSQPTVKDVTPTLYSCDRLTGHCQYGCPSDLAGPYCNISCFDNKIYNCDICDYDYSRNVPICKQCSRHFYQTSEGKCRECSTHCVNYNSTTSRCNHNDGSCSFGCTGIYYGLTCNIRCTIFCNPRLCDRMNGCCTEGCYYKYRCGCRCNEPCSFNCNNGVCDHDCTCTEGCKPGFYGSKCEQLCSENCASLNGSADTCNSTTGHCYNGCVNDTFWTETCELPCSEGCANDTCVQETGECTRGCTTLSLYGHDCSLYCNHTCNDQLCMREDGTCLQGCLKGWYGTFCEYPCDPNYCLDRCCSKGFNVKTECGCNCNETCDRHISTDGSVGATTGESTWLHNVWMYSYVTGLVVIMFLA